MNRALRILPVIALAVYFATGFYKVEPEELAVVKRFGKVTERAVPSGLHWRLPAPFETHETFQTTTVYKMGVGMITRDYLRGIPSPEELSLFLTGDTNILSVKMITVEGAEVTLGGDGLDGPVGGKTNVRVPIGLDRLLS